MPGKVSGSTPRAPRRTAASKTSTSRKTTTSVDVPDEGENTSLRREFCYIFADSQKSTASHRRNVLKLRKLQESCCYEAESPKNHQQVEDFSEDDFDQEFMRCLLRVLPVKKAESVAERVIRFVGTFLAHAIEKDSEIWDQAGYHAERDTPTARLVSLIFTTLLPMLQAKDKTIRFRSTQIISHLINSVNEIDPDLFLRLRLALEKRAYDKEAPVRLQAVCGLVTLAQVTNDEEDSDEEDEDESDEEDREERDPSDPANEMDKRLLKRLRRILEHDSSGDVRRNVLLNLPATSKTLRRYLLARGRDVDTNIRRAVLTRVVPSAGDFRTIQVAERKQVLRYGLLDREDSVRKLAAKMFSEHWIERCVALPGGAPPTSEDDDHPNKAATPSMDALVELLERIEVVDTGREDVNNGLEDGIAGVAMREFWAARPDYVEFVSFPNEFWEDLTPEMAFLVRSFNDYCRSPTQEDGPINRRALDSMADEKMPEVTKFGFLLERELKRLTEAMVLAATEPSEENNEEYKSHEFIVLQMLHMALTFDYSDEMGRRKMLGLMRETLALPDLPENITQLVVDVLRLLCGEGATAERDFCGMVIDDVYAIQYVLEPDSADEAESSAVEDTFHSATSYPDDEKDNIADVRNRRMAATSADMNREEVQIELKCLHITLYMLQNIQRDIQGNQQLEDYVNTRVIDAIRCRVVSIRELGLKCLALTCLLSKTFANEHFDLITAFFTKEEDANIQAISIQSIIDILTVHPTVCNPDVDPDASDVNTNGRAVRLLKILSASLRSDEDIIQTAGAVAISKAMLHGLINNEDLLKRLVASYFDVDNLGRPQFQQALAYFLPVYCHSRTENAERMARVTVGTISRIINVDAEEAGDGLLKLSTISQMLIDWTDPRKTIGYADAAATDPDTAPLMNPSARAPPRADSSHFILARGILERLNASQLVIKEEKKALLPMLSKLHLPPGDCAPETIAALLQLATEAIDADVADDESGRKALEKFRTAMLALIRDVMTAERGGGGAEETVLESTEVDAETLRPGARGPAGTMGAGTEVEDEDDDEEGEEEGADEGDAERQLQREMRESTLDTTLDATLDTTLDATAAGFGFTTGLPDAEGTRIQDLYDEGTTVENTDTEMMDVDG